MVQSMRLIAAVEMYADTRSSSLGMHLSFPGRGRGRCIEDVLKLRLGG